MKWLLYVGIFLLLCYIFPDLFGMVLAWLILLLFIVGFVASLFDEMNGKGK